MSTRILILKDGVITPAKTSTDTTNIINSLGVVDLSSNQTIGGIKTFSGGFALPTTIGTTVGTVWRNVDTLEYKDSTNVTKIILNSAGNLSNLSNKQLSLNNLVGTQIANRLLRSNGTDVILSQVGLTTDVTSILPIANGGTNSSTQNWVDLTTNQNMAGQKYLLKPIVVGSDSSGVIQSFTNSDIRTINSTIGLNSLNGSLTLTTAPSTTFSFLNNDYEISSSTNVALPSFILGGFFRVLYKGTGIASAVQGLRLVAFNSGAGNITTLDGAAFVARCDTASTTVGTINGGNFTVSTLNVATTVNTLNAGIFTASSAVSALSTTVRGILVNTSSSNTTPATDCIGIDITNITGTATNKFAIRTGTGIVSFGDTTASTSTATGGALFLGGVGIAGRLSAATGYFSTAFGAGNATFDFTNSTIKMGVGTAGQDAIFSMHCSGSGLGAIGFDFSATRFVFGSNAGLAIDFCTNLGSTPGADNFASATAVLRVQNSNIICPVLPTSSAGLPVGALWRNGTVVNIV